MSLKLPLNDGGVAAQNPDEQRDKHPESPAPSKSEIESTQSTVFSVNTSCLEAVLKVFRRRTCGHRGSVGIKQSQLSQGAQLSGKIFRRIAFFLKKKKQKKNQQPRTIEPQSPQTGKTWEKHLFLPHVCGSGCFGVQRRQISQSGAWRE
jgi:hypothetical protein